MIRSASLFLAVSALATPVVADACRIMRSPSQMISSGYQEGMIGGVAIVAIERAIPHPEVSPQGELKPWQASARTVHRVEGELLPEKVDFALGFGSSMCETSHYPIPEQGDLYAVYFIHSETGAGLVPWRVYPLWEARMADPRLWAIQTT